MPDKSFIFKFFGKHIFNFHYPLYDKGSQQVDYRWPGVGWGEFLVSNYDIVYASIDGRGTGFQSDEYTYQLYKQLGTVEMEVSVKYIAYLKIMFNHRINIMKTKIYLQNGYFSLFFRTK